MIRIDKLNKYYNKGRKNQIHVINNTNVELPDKGLVALLGPSGCGKSTILNLVSDITKPTSGTITKPKAIGYMFQKDNLLEWLNILDNVLIGLKISKKLTLEKKEYAIYLLNKYGLGDFIYSYPNELSGGMRQRVALIRAIILSPEILLLDEAFSALDSQTRLKVSNDIYKIIKELNITTIMVTHDISEAISLADNVLILTDRPATLKENIVIEFNNLCPNERRKHPLFTNYFDKIWGEINDERT